MNFLKTTSLGTRSNVSKYKVDCTDENKPGYAYFSESMGKGKK